MGLIMWIIIGLIVSLLTFMTETYIIRRHIPITIFLGVIGAVIGGAIGSYLGFGALKGMRFMIVVLAIEGSGFLLTWYRAFEKANSQ